MTDSAALSVRLPTESWGLPHTVQALHMAYGRLRAHFADGTRVQVGDLSRQYGGPIDHHASHQNGRDADVAYITHECVGSFCSLGEIQAADIDVSRQWYIFKQWLKAGTVQYIFMRYEFEKPLYEYAKARGATDAQLEKWFQYPRPKSMRLGIIRNWPHHATHYHVRFKKVK